MELIKIGSTLSIKHLLISPTAAPLTQLLDLGRLYGKLSRLADCY